MKNKVLTISVAAYNVKDYINETLESLIEPEILNNLEVIIVNDGSTDATSIIVEEYVKRYPNVFKLVNKKNGGYGSTINTSIKIATGKYFKQLDGDDWFDKNNLAEFIEFLKSSDADCIFSPYWEVYQSTKKKKLKKVVGTKDILRCEDINMHSLAFKKDIFLKNEIYLTEKCFYTDCEYNIKALMFSDTMDYFDKPIYCYRLELAGQSVSREGWKKHYREHNYVTLELMSYYEKNKEKVSASNKVEIEKYILTIYKTNLNIALELEDKNIYEDYKQMELTIKETCPSFYARRNLKMIVLTKSNYKLWEILRIFHILFEKKIFNEHNNN